MEYIVLWILALFGLWSLVSNILDSFYYANREGSIDIILEVFNQEDSIQILLKQLSRIDMVRNIKIFDKGSTDNTLAIIQEMQKINSKIILKYHYIE